MIQPLHLTAGLQLLAGTPLSATSLATAIKMLRQMKDAEGNLLDLQPAVLLVPPELEQIALALIHSSEVQRVATGDLQPTGNTFKDIATLAVEPRLSDLAFTGNSAVAWYLFSNAMNASVIVGLLDGMESPTLESFGVDHDVNTLAFSFRVWHDYGCALAFVMLRLGAADQQPAAFPIHVSPTTEQQRSNNGATTEQQRSNNGATTEQQRLGRRSQATKASQGEDQPPFVVGARGE